MSRILIADDDRDLVQLLSRRCRSLGLQVTPAENAMGALQAVHQQLHDVIITDVNMPAGSGLGVCEMLRADEQLARIPVIVLTGDPCEETIRRCHQLCAYYIDKSGDVWHRVEPLLRELLDMPPATAVEPPAAAQPKPPHEVVDAIFAALGADDQFLGHHSRGAEPVAQPALAEEPEPWILHVDDDLQLTEVLKARLAAHGVSVIRAFDGSSGLRTAMTHPASAIILDFEMPNGQGDYVLDRLKSNAVTQDIPVVVLSGKRDKSLERRMLALGAECYLHKPVQFDELLREVRRHIGSAALAN